MKKSIKKLLTGIIIISLLIGVVYSLVTAASDVEIDYNFYTGSAFNYARLEEFLNDHKNGTIKTGTDGKTIIRTGNQGLYDTSNLEHANFYCVQHGKHLWGTNLQV